MRTRAADGQPCTARRVLASAVLIVVWVLWLPSAHAQSVAPEPVLRVTLLGTGGPELSSERFGYATLIEAGGQLLLFDAGRGVLQRLYESKVNVTRVTQVFFTHLHNDHIEGLPSLWMTPWFLLGRDQPMEAWGPGGTARMISGMEAMFHFDIPSCSRVTRPTRRAWCALDEVRI